MGISRNAMARAIGVSPRAINEIVLGKRSITPSMSIRFGAFFGQSEDFWHGIQVKCDFRALRKEEAKLTAKIRTAEELVGGEGLRRSEGSGPSLESRVGAAQSRHRSCRLTVNCTPGAIFTAKSNASVKEGRSAMCSSRPSTSMP